MNITGIINVSMINNIKSGLELLIFISVQNVGVRLRKMAVVRICNALFVNIPGAGYVVNTLIAFSIKFK